jgi:Holliday junction resolvase
MATTTAKNREPTDALYRVKRGLSAYVSYLAACEMNQAFSEYVLYEPILRILTARGYSVECEYECPGIKQPKQGDKRRIDFYAIGHSLQLAIEVKWAKSEKPDIKRDVEKLQAFLTATPGLIALLCVFGRQSQVEALELTTGHFKERGNAVYADLRKTRYGCRIYQLQSPKRRAHR